MLGPRPMRVSPAARRSPRAWTWLVALVVLLLGGSVSAAITAPRWAAPMVKDALVEKLSGRLGAPVELEALELHWGRAVLTGLRIGGGDHPRLDFDRVVVDVDADALWRVRVDVEQVLVEGGRIQGERAGLEEFARRISKGRDEPSPEADQEKTGHDLIPDRLRATDLWVVVSEASGEQRDRRVETRVEVDAMLPERRARLELRDLRVDPGRGPVVTARVLQTDVEAVRGDSGLKVQFPMRVQVRGMAAPVSTEIAVAGVDGWVQVEDRELSEIQLDLQGSFSGTASADAEDGSEGDTTNGPKLWSAAGRLRRDFSQGQLRVDMASFELGKVPRVLETLPLVQSQDATVGGYLAVVFADGVARLEGDVQVEGLNVDHRTLARTVVRDIGFALTFAAEVDPASRRLVLHYADLERRGVKMRMRGEVDHPARRQGRRQRLHLEVPPVPCQTVLDAIPAELVPSLTKFELGGQFDGEVELDIDYADLEQLVLEGGIGIYDCNVLRAPAHAAAERLAGGFTHRVRMRDGRTRTIQMYPSSRSFTSFKLISPYMVSAVLTTEDGGFWRHRGFLPSQFRVALKRNLGSGQIELGASTITMQMVKNVLLSHERTLSRKLQEMFLTWYVETALTKERIMEIYLNGIEYGPGIYGITDAADHYFGKHPVDLNPPEAAYLALMLPSPVRRHAQYCRGELTPAFEAKLQRILRFMNERGRLGDLEYELWRDIPLQFDLRARGSEAQCYEQIERVQAGSMTQMALSGLLGEDELFDEPPPAPVQVDFGSSFNELPSLEHPAEVDAPGRPAMDAGDRL